MRMSILADKNIMNESELKKILKEIKSGQKNWDDENKRLIVRSMINHIGSTDGELRDQLIYTTFFKLIIEKNLLETELLKELLDCSVNHLMFKGIGETGTDTVFTRSFSTLLIALILYKDNAENFLTGDTTVYIKQKLIQYITLEKDLRGFVSDKGWAHSIAHVADTFDELIKNPEISEEDYVEILQQLLNKILVSESVYVHDEDERILTPILEMLDNGLDVKVIEEWLQELPMKLEGNKRHLDCEKYWFLVFNIKTFLKTFYIKINSDKHYESLQNSIRHCLTKIR
ncbi:DUF2785 domain-containing protein [Bacillus sp. Marseille-Q3570]|uniref:DUF2785 domain-containing protein n=1 Tax=Bacillus sp. Marseille-Q3570 TaxID=2963522 RepID=UPI0021B740B2|nr:DUF2785 domain-containing protein [Bacillus sp. Marseille-Q3570]